jgi:Protein of unknown function (DUF1501)
MLTFFNDCSERFCDGVSRRSFLKVGGLALGGLALSDFLRLKAAGAVTPECRGKSIIMICLGGGPSHVDMYDMKPAAPAEIRGEFRQIKSNVPGMEMSELLPRQAKIADKFAVVRTVTWQEPDHQRIEIFTGFPKRERRPSFGSYVSRLTLERRRPGNRGSRAAALGRVATSRIRARQQGIEDSGNQPPGGLVTAEEPEGTAHAARHSATRGRCQRRNARFRRVLRPGA